MIIKEWALEDRPREKLYQHGAKQLTNAELLAIILSTGTKSISAVQLSQNILSFGGNDLEKLATMNISELKKIKGVGHVKAIKIKAVLELANRKGSAKTQFSQIKCSGDAFEILKPIYADLNTEEFWVLYLNRANKVIAKKKLSLGGIAGTLVDIKVIFHHALVNFATAIVLSHNHPSGNLHPSQKDIELTKKICGAARQLDINVFDHLIVAGGYYNSFADSGLL